MQADYFIQPEKTTFDMRRDGDPQHAGSPSRVPLMRLILRRIHFMISIDTSGFPPFYEGTNLKTATRGHKKSDVIFWKPGRDKKISEELYVLINNEKRRRL